MADRTFRRWAKTPTAERAAHVRAFASAIAEHRNELVELESANVGKLAAELPREIDGLVRHANVMADIIENEDLLGEPPGRPSHSHLVWEPYGVVAAVLPWNAPLNAAVRRVAITIATGNTVVLKPSVLGTTTPVRVAQIAEVAGVPSGVVNVLTGPGETVGTQVVTHPNVAKISFVGGTDAGVGVMRAAGERVVPFVAELGGKSPQIVFADAPRDKALTNVLRGFTRNAGQICTCGTRLLVERSIARAFVDELCAKADAIVVGDARSAASDMGPQISVEHRAAIAGFVDRARTSGLRVRAGGRAEVGAGWFYRPTVIDQVGPDDEIFRHEVFGPVLAVTTFDSESGAINLANTGDYGLVAGVWTADRDRALRVASALDVGRVWVNGYWASDPTLSSTPHRRSGIGAAETGTAALLEFLRPKEVTVLGMD